MIWSPTCYIHVFLPIDIESFAGIMEPVTAPLV